MDNRWWIWGAVAGFGWAVAKVGTQPDLFSQAIFLALAPIAGATLGMFLGMLWELWAQRHDR